jgi:hypothetical protein
VFRNAELFRLETPTMITNPLSAPVTAARLNPLLSDLLEHNSPILQRTTRGTTESIQQRPSTAADSLSFEIFRTL